MESTSAARAPKQGVESNYRWVILLVTLVVQAGTAAPGQSVPIFGPIMQAEFGLTRAELGLLQTALALGQMVIIGASGLLTDRIGIRRMLLAGMSVIGFFVVVAGVGGAYVLALVAFLLAGAGAALVNPSMVKAIMYWFQPRIRATAMSIKQTGVPIGGVIAAVMMPSIALAHGWRVLVIGLGLCIIAAGVMCFFLCQEYPETGAAKPIARKVGIEDWLRLLKRRDVLLVSFLGAPMLSVQFALVTYVVLYLQEDFSYSLVLGGIVLSLIQFSSAVGRVFWGLASDNWFRGDRRATIMAAFSLAAIGMVVLAVLPNDAPFWAVCGLAVLAGGTAVAWNGIWMTQATELAGRELAGSASGIAIMIGQLGIMLGPPLFGAVVDNTGSYRIGWLLLAALCAVAVLVAIAVRSPRKVEPMAGS